MVCCIDSFDITGMKQTDFIQLKQIFYNHKEEGSYWGRKDYWEQRMDRLEKWLNRINESLIDCVIKEEEL